MVRVKICGLTNEEDLELALSLGVYAVGFVLEPSSPRVVTPERALELNRIVRGRAISTAVFGPLAWFDGLAAFDAVQYRSGTPELVARLANPVPALTLAEAEGFHGRTLVLEPTVPGMHGGTGVQVDWDAARSFVEKHTGNVFLAGGLTADNVADAIAKVQPYGVDVSSGIERSVGRKDPLKLAAFVTACDSQAKK